MSSGTQPAINLEEDEDEEKQKMSPRASTTLSIPSDRGARVSIEMLCCSTKTSNNEILYSSKSGLLTF